MEGTGTSRQTRRALLAGAAGAVMGLAAQALGRPGPVHAEGEIIHVGDEFITATSVTALRNTSNASTVLLARSDGGGVGIDGFSGSNVGVAGESVSGIGVYGVSSTGIGAVLEGGSAPLRLAAKPTPGKPTTGSHLKGEIYMDSKAGLFVCTAAGSPGTWRKVLTKLV